MQIFIWKINLCFCATLAVWPTSDNPAVRKDAFKSNLRDYDAWFSLSSLNNSDIDIIIFCCVGLMNVPMIP